MTTTISKHELQLIPAGQFDTLNNNNNTTARSEPQKRRSLLNFKSFDFHIKSLYSGLRSNPKTESTGSVDPTLAHSRMLPYLRIEGVDGEVEMEAIDQYISPYELSLAAATRSQTAVDEAPSPWHLSPPSMVVETAGIRRSSTSDIVACRRRPSPSPSPSESGGSRRPSTSDLLRKARERRSVSHSGLSRGGIRGSGMGMGGGGRRTSMAF